MPKPVKLEQRNLEFAPLALASRDLLGRRPRIAQTAFLG